jgi:predicted transcriptional regulator
MTKQQYRSELQMMSDILRVTMDRGIQGIIISSIARNANLSHYSAIEKCQKLIDSGLMESRIVEKSTVFTITEKGINFFRELEKFLETAQAIKIR